MKWLEWIYLCLTVAMVAFVVGFGIGLVRRDGQNRSEFQGRLPRLLQSRAGQRTDRRGTENIPAMFCAIWV